MKNARVLAVSVLLASPLVLLTLACDPPKPNLSCGSIGTLPQSDAGVWDIKAHSTTCTTARSLALSWHQHSAGHPYTWHVVWSCTGPIYAPNQLGNDVWCNGPGGGVVTFTNVG
jgi:hypothetical protein